MISLDGKSSDIAAPWKPAPFGVNKFLSDPVLS